LSLLTASFRKGRNASADAIGGRRIARKWCSSFWDIFEKWLDEPLALDTT